MSCCKFEFKNIRYVWYDMTDRNLKYNSDKYEGGLAEALGAKPFSFVITWNGDSTWQSCDKGNNRPVITGMWKTESTTCAK